MKEDCYQNGSEPEMLSAEEQWKRAHPEIDEGAYVVRRSKEKHGFGYWIKEFFRLAGIPVLLFALIWIGSYYLFFAPREESVEPGVSVYFEEYNGEDRGRIEIRNDGKKVKLPNTEAEEGATQLLGYQVPTLPEGFTWVRGRVDNLIGHGDGQFVYQNQAGDTIDLRVVQKSDYSIYKMYVVQMEETSVHGCPGLRVEYNDGLMELTWGDLEHTAILWIRASGLDFETLWALSEDFVFVGE